MWKYIRVFIQLILGGMLLTTILLQGLNYRLKEMAKEKLEQARQWGTQWCGQNWMERFEVYLQKQRENTPKEMQTNEWYQTVTLEWEIHNCKPIDMDKDRVSVC